MESVKCRIDYLLTSARKRGALKVVRAGVYVLQVLHAVDIGARLRELDALPLGPPAVDILLARVVRGERALLVVVLVEQVPEVPRAVTDVDLGVVQVRCAEAAAPGADRDALGRLGLQLHQAERAGARFCVGAELALLVDDGRDESRVEVVVARVAPDDLLVLQRVADAVEPCGLAVSQVDEADRHRRDEDHEREELTQTHAAVSVRTTSATKASSSSSEPSFTYEKSARSTLSPSGISRCSRSSSRSPARIARSSRGAVITTTASNRPSTPAS